MEPGRLEPQLSGVTLRGYRPADLDAMYALDVACFEAPFRFSREMVRQSAEAANARVVLAERDERLIGFAILHVERFRVERQQSAKAGYVVTLDVAEDERRHGVARLMMEALEREALAAACRVVLLHVFQGNEGAIRFYERLGFARTGVAHSFYAKGLDAWVYSKRVSAVAS